MSTSRVLSPPRVVSARGTGLAALALFAVFASGAPPAAQERAGDSTRDAAVTDAAPAANPADVESIDALLAALYDVISGPAGERDWDRFRSLFHADGRMSPVVPRQAGGFTVRVMTPDDYVAANAPYFLENGFHESEVHRVVERFGHVAHVFSTYEARRAPDAEPFMRGVNSLQLVFDGTRWSVLSITWDGERPGQSIPARYLPDADDAAR